MGVVGSDTTAAGAQNFQINTLGGRGGSKNHQRDQSKKRFFFHDYSPTAVPWFVAKAARGDWRGRGGRCLKWGSRKNSQTMRQTKQKMIKNEKMEGEFLVTE